MGSLLSETIASVEAVYNPALHEVIVVDDGSTDEATKEVLGKLTGHTVLHKNNGGLASARNAGIAASKSDFLLFLDADNLLTDGYLTKGIKILQQQPEVDIVYGESEFFGNEGGLWFTKAFNLQTLMSFNYIDACTLVRKRLFDDIGGFDENMPVMGMEDWEMWLRASFYQKKFYYLEGVIIQKYRVRSNSMIRVVQKKNRDAVYEYLQKKYPRYLNFSEMDDYYYKKFHDQTAGWTAKLFIKKYLPSIYQRLLKKGKISRYL